MARRNIFDNVMKAMEPQEGDSIPPVANSVQPVASSTQPVARYGAAKSISSSIDELARQANQLVEGASVIEIDTALIDASFVADRMEGEDEAFDELVEAIRSRGQDSPVLLRPHPHKDGRYQTIFGHRRVRAMRALGCPVRAVIRTMADIELVLAQGQENSVRSNLSFIERVLFAQRLHDRGFDRDVILSALSVDYQTLSKMLTIPKVIPAALIDAIGAAKSIGRDRWLELRKLLERPGQTALALEFCGDPALQEAPSDERFRQLFALVEGKAGAVKKSIAPRPVENWTSPDKAVSATIARSGANLTLQLRAKGGAGKGGAGQGDFGSYLSRHLGDLYRDFLAGEKTGQLGD
jgi:ParB family transcriptional regulator, chromosome partitioning protein